MEKGEGEEDRGRKGKERKGKERKGKGGREGGKEEFMIKSRLKSHHLLLAHMTLPSAAP